MYTYCLIGISLFSIIVTLYQSIKNNNEIRKMTKYECPVELRIANNNFVTISSIDLVPGDVIKVPSNVLLPCDFILLSGSVIMNEAILTGESIPVMKTSLPNT